MTKDELLALLKNAKTVGIMVLGKTFNIKSWANGTYSIEDKDKKSFITFHSAFELVENYMVMNMSLEALTPWINVTKVA